MRKINKNRGNNFKTKLVSRRRLIFTAPSLLAIFFVISYSFLLFFNVQNTYAINNNKSEVVTQQNATITLKSEYLSRISEIETNMPNEDYKQLKKVVYLDGGLNNVAFGR